MSGRAIASFGAALVMGLSALVVPASAPVHGAEGRTTRVVLQDRTGDVWMRGEGENADWESAGDVPTADVIRGVVRHGPYNVIVRMTFTDLRRSEAQNYLAAFVSRKGYGLVLVSAGPGRWRGSHELVDEEFGTVRCRPLRHSIDYAADQVAIKIPRRCIGRPPWVRVSMSNLIFRAGADESDFREVTDNPHSSGPEESFTRRIYRQRVCD